MATGLKNLSEYNHDAVPGAGAMKIGLVVSEWNYEGLPIFGNHSELAARTTAEVVTPRKRAT